MNYGQLKSEIRDLGFSEDAEIAEFADIVLSVTFHDTKNAVFL